MTKRPVETLKPGDVILPPERELRLWMRRTCEERGLDESALYLTVEEAAEGIPDKRGPWVVLITRHSEAWTDGRHSSPFRFRARPGTLWPVVV